MREPERALDPPERALPREEDAIYCDGCGEVMDSLLDGYVRVDGGYYCEICARELARCADCEERIEPDDEFHVSGETLCESCARDRLAEEGTA